MGKTIEEGNDERLANEKKALREELTRSKNNFQDDFDDVSRGLYNLTLMEGCSPVLSHFVSSFNTDMRTKTNACVGQYDHIINRL